MRCSPKLFTGLFIPVLLAGCAASESPSQAGDVPATPSQAETALVSLAETHVHGLAVDRGNGKRLFIATHDGLLVLENDSSLVYAGRSRDDFMGFSPHPTESDVLFSSGHPSFGGNLGVQKSTDGGESWEKISNGGSAGPVDFHAMAVHPADPDLILGWYAGSLHRSTDGGKNWEIITQLPPAISLAGDSRNADVLYAATQQGLLSSTDKGATWSAVPELQNVIVLDIEPDTTSGGLLLSTAEGIMMFGPGLGGGMITNALGPVPGSEPALHIAIDPNASQVVYAIAGHSLYKSTDGGKTWQKAL